MTRLLFVCLGNICRSPAGENTLRHLLRENDITDVSLDSAGTAGYHIGKGPDPRMTATLEERGIRVTGTARQFSKQDFDDFDLILAMDEDNRKDILRLARSEADRAKVKPFMSFCKNFSNAEVPDPYYGGQDGFDLVADIMADGCAGILSAIAREQGQK
ncbi:low molecular weight protein-tyrosine-phosphatase [Roseibacillus ishigakijimensis]|uniref:Low molecular weight phosphotyrosine protein phosphatase n=1 Tax=Roseibacillus ishigakijimensis TaxID=454146 RepID=A0A934RKY1_9BACT|nr:low molecular weight protein-tyrosine-phosphatase [Roseibacillus ishigakijimensis]MBK1833617.1 low molecular weight phosphotyrosine protein phosphatase [Roseibacillus ishigakijimensis]